MPIRTIRSSRGLPPYEFQMNRFITNIFAILLLAMGSLLGQTLIYDGAFSEEECQAWQLPPGACWIEEDGEQVLQVQGNGNPGCVVLASISRYNEPPPQNLLFGKPKLRGCRAFFDSDN